MALATQDINLAKQKTRVWARDPGVQGQLKALFSYLETHKANPDLEYKAFAALAADTALADAACKLYAVYFRKQNEGTGAFAKLTDHATVSAGDAAALTVELNVANEDCLVVYPEGSAYGTGITANCSTTIAGTTDSGADEGPDGFVLIGDA